VWWIVGLEEGDGVVAGFDCYDLTPGGSPSGRIWAHESDGVDIDSYVGSAGGNSTYSDGYGWTNLEWSWSFDSNGGAAPGLVIEARIYSGSTGSGTNDGGNTIYIDNAWIVVSNDNAMIYNPAGQTIPEPFLGLGALLGLALLRRVR
jgi:hypothetical protein